MYSAVLVDQELYLWVYFGGGVRYEYAVDSGWDNVECCGAARAVSVHMDSVSTFVHFLRGRGLL